MNTDTQSVACQLFNLVGGKYFISHLVFHILLKVAYKIVEDAFLLVAGLRGLLLSEEKMIHVLFFDILHYITRVCSITSCDLDWSVFKMGVN